jgi:hypothetical protein
MMLPVLRAMLRIRWTSQMSRASTEIRWHQKRVDLGFMSDDDLVVVELKVSDWRRAVRQAFLNRWVAQSSWVALWHEGVSVAAVEAAREAGVGLLIVTRRTAYPLVNPGPPMRPGAESPVQEALFAQGTRMRDLLGEAREVHRAAFA